MGKANRIIVICILLFISMMLLIAWTTVSGIRERDAAAAAAAPRMTCSFAQWCVEGDCTVAAPADFILITKGRFQRTYLRMDGRSGDVVGFIGPNAGFVRDDDVVSEDSRWPRRYMHIRSELAEVNMYLQRSLDFEMTYDLEEGDVPDLAMGDAEGRGTCEWIVEEPA